MNIEQAKKKKAMKKQMEMKNCKLLTKKKRRNRDIYTELKKFSSFSSFSFSFFSFTHRKYTKSCSAN
jgi:hypothetical protein